MIQILKQLLYLLRAYVNLYFCPYITFIAMGTHDGQKQVTLYKLSVIGYNFGDLCLLNMPHI